MQLSTYFCHIALFNEPFHKHPVSVCNIIGNFEIQRVVLEINIMYLYLCALSFSHPIEEIVSIDNILLESNIVRK